MQMWRMALAKFQHWLKDANSSAGDLAAIPIKVCLLDTRIRDSFFRPNLSAINLHYSIVFFIQNNRTISNDIS
jgi:hypothetical protein